MTDVSPPDSSEAPFAAESQSESASLDVLFDVLAHRRRRYAIQCLSDTQGRLSLADLAADVAALERDASLAAIPDDVVNDVRTSLYHSHIPRLADANLVALDEDRKTVALAAESDHVKPFVEAVTAEG